MRRPDSSDIARLQHEHDVLVVRNTRLILEMRAAKRELEEANTKIAKISAGYKEIKRDNKEIRGVLQANDGYKKME